MKNSKSSSFLFVEKDNLILIKVIKFKCLFFKKQKVLSSYMGLVLMCCVSSERELALSGHQLLYL